MVRTMRISFLALGLLGLYTNTSCMSAKLSSCADAVRASINTINMASARKTLASTGNVLRTINTYAPIITLGAVTSLVLGTFYAEHRQRQLYNARNAAENKLSATRQELIACRTWADQWYIPALKTLNVEHEILDNPATWTVYCSNLSTARVLACVQRLSNYQLDPSVLLCKLTAQYNHTAQLFATYKTQFNTWKAVADKRYIDQTNFDEFGYSTVMVPIYLRKIEFLKTLIKTRSYDITQSTKNQYYACACAA